MKRCAVFGVIKTPLLFVLLTFFFFLIRPVYASEFGNTLGSSGARQASAAILDGVSRLFMALRERELSNLDTGREHLTAAVKALTDGAAQLRDIQVAQDDNKQLSLDGVPPSDVQVVAFVAEANGRSFPTDVSNLKESFVLETERFASTIGKYVGANERPIYPELAEIVARYVRFGGGVTSLGQNLR